MEKEKKMTKRDYFNQLLGMEEIKADENLVKFIEHELELLAKKNASGEGKQTATQKANEEIKNGIVECLENEPNRLFTITEMIKEFDVCKPFVNQKISNLANQLVKENRIAKIEEKRKSFFKAI
jgi:hypothetical protein